MHKQWQIYGLNLVQLPLQKTHIDAIATPRDTPKTWRLTKAPHLFAFESICYANRGVYAEVVWSMLIENTADHSFSGSSLSLRGKGKAEAFWRYSRSENK